MPWKLPGKMSHLVHLFENSGKKVVTEQIIITPDFMLNQFQKFISNEIEGFQSIKKEPNKGKGYSFVF